MVVPGWATGGDTQGHRQWVEGNQAPEKKQSILLLEKASKNK